MSFVDALGERFSGPMSFRLILQPVMALILAVMAGIRDARRGATPYLWTLFTQADRRMELIRDLMRGVGRVFILAMIMEVVYQYAVRSFVSLGEAAAVSFLLAILPYLVLRGLVTRIVRRMRP